MKRNEFLISVWKYNIRPTLLPFILVCFALFLIRSDFDQFSEIEFGWSSIGQLFSLIGNVFLAVIRESWWILLLVLIPVFAFGSAEKRISPPYLKRFKKTRRIIISVIVSGIVIYLGYTLYLREEYRKMIWLAVLLVVNLIISYTIKEPKPE